MSTERLAELWSMVEPLVASVTLEGNRIMPELEPETCLKVYMAILRWEDYRARLLGLYDLELPDWKQAQRPGGLTDKTAQAIKSELGADGDSARCISAAAHYCSLRSRR
jgi:hypothetical protein